jgi:hypothetical protein
MVLQSPIPKLALCELYHSDIHGNTEDSDPYIHEHIMVLDTFETIEELQESLENYPVWIRPRPEHPCIRNYNGIVRNRRVFGAQIVYVMELSGGESVGIIRTGGLRRLQRRWRASRP